MCLAGQGYGDDECDNAESVAEDNKKLHKIVASTLLEEEDLASLFDESRCEGTRGYRGLAYDAHSIPGHLPDSSDASLVWSGDAELPCSSWDGVSGTGDDFSFAGGHCLLSDQIDILSQLESNA